MSLSRLSLTVAAVAMLSAPAFADGHAKAGMISIASPHDVATTVEKLTAVIEKSPATLFTVIDHGAGAQKVGLDLPPAVLVLFGNPKIGTPIMQANPQAGLDLPIRVLVRQGTDGTVMEARSAKGLADAYGIAMDGPAGAALGQMEGAVTNILGAAAK